MYVIRCLNMIKPSESVVSAWIALMRTQQAMLLQIERAFKEAGHPPLHVYDVLWELDQAGTRGLRPVEIEQQVLVHQSNISRMLDRLAKDGLVERQPCEEDGRSHRVNITADGCRLRRAMWATYGPAIQRVVGAQISDADAQTLARLLNQMRT